MIELTVTIATAPSIAVSLDDDSASVSVSTGSVTVPVGFIGVGGGDMVASVYDPGSISGDAFSMGNMVETSASKVFTDVERSKLSNIETGATADQTASEIKTAYESRPDTNAFTDAEKSLLSDQSGVNTGDQDLSVYQIKPSEGGFVSGDKTKLDGIETGATGDQTAAEIRVLVGSAHDSNVFADADRTKLDGIEAGADVTDAANVQASGAVMDSEIANLPELKSFDPLDYATSAQGSKADSAIQPGDIDTLADLNAAVSDATLIDTGDSRLSDSRAPTTHSGSHTDGTDDIQSATAAQKGLATAAHISKLNSIETGADVTDTANVVSALTPGTNITISGDGTISATGTQLSNEEVQDIVGGMVAGNAESGITVAYDDAGGKLDFTVASQTDENFTTADHAKLDGIAAGAEVNDPTTLLDSDIGSTVQGYSAALDSVSGTNTGDQDLSGYQAKPAEGAFADGDKTKLDSIEAGADITDTANVVSALTPGTNITIAGDGTISATGTQLSNEEVQDIVGGMVAGNTESGITVAYDDIGGKLDFAVASQTDENFTTADHAKLDGIEAGADVTDASNVSAAGAVMESDFSPAHSVLVQQSGTGSPTSVSIGTESLLGRTSDPGTAIASLSKTSVRAILNVENGATADQTPSEILAAIKTLDGTGSGLDADLLDGQEASAFATAAQGTLADSATQPGDNISTLTNDSGFTGDQTAADIRALGFFDASNDGAASGLDADLLDGNHASAFATAAQGSAADSALQSGDIDTLAELNSIVTDATLIDTADSRLSDSRTCDNTFDNASTSRTNLGLGTAAVESAASLSPAGGIQAYAGSSSPTGWLICDGSAVSRTTYSDLFAAISTTYGVGDGSTTFNLPDISGRVIAGKESTATLLTSGGSGVDGATLGATGGAEEHTLTEAEMPSHTHTQNYRPNTAPRSSGSTDTTSPAATTPQTGSAGGDEAHNNVQPTIILNWIIKT